MALKNNKTVDRITTCFLVFFALRIVEELYIVPKMLDTLGLIVSVLGTAFLLWYIRQLNKPVEEIGILYSRHKIRKAISLSLMINGIAAVLGFAAVLALRNMGLLSINVGYANVEGFFDTRSIGVVLAGCAVAVIVSAIHAVFYETAFRGLMITLSARSYQFPAANTIQTVLYTVLRVSAILRLVLYRGGETGVLQILILVLLMSVYTMLVAVRLGLLRRVTGAIWACMFDHFLFSSLLNITSVQYIGGGLLKSNMNYLFMIAYQIVAMIVTVIYYAKTMPKVKQKMQQHHSSGHHHHSHSKPEEQTTASEHVEHRRPHSGEHSHSHSGEHSHTRHHEHVHAETDKS